MLPDPPPRWGTDALTEYLDTAHANRRATFANLSDEYARLSDIDGAFLKAIGALNNTEDWLSGVLMMRAHSAFRCGAQQALSTQLPESYACLRLALEDALYGFHLAGNTELQETWLKRHDNSAAKKAVKSEFQIRNLLDAFAKADAAEAARARELYEHAIDYGAHPNERSVTQSLEMDGVDGGVKIKSPYFAGDTAAFRVCLRSAMRVGVCCLSVFRSVYPERFDLIGLSEQLKGLKRGL